MAMIVSYSLGYFDARGRFVARLHGEAPWGKSEAEVKAAMVAEAAERGRNFCSASGAHPGVNRDWILRATNTYEA